MNDFLKKVKHVCRHCVKILKASVVDAADVVIKCFEIIMNEGREFLPYFLVSMKQLHGFVIRW